MKKLVLAVLTTMSFGLVAQNNVWVKIPNYETKRSLIAKELMNLNITYVKQAFPSSRNPELQKVYEIACNCDVNDLLVATSKNTMFVKPELGPQYQTLYTPDDLSIYYFDYALNSINAEQAWDITHGDTAVVIAISDANYHIYHEELAGKISYKSQENYNADYTHGTAVAITAAGNTNNGTGKSSIGYNSKLQLRTMDYNELLEATYSGAKVINTSWASSCYYNSYAQQIIDEVHANGSIIIAAAGNGSTCGGASSLIYPASFNHVISVTSVGPNNNHERYIGNASSTHQHNSMVDISAPGYDIALSTAPGYYITGNGTSFAAPLVSGTVALMLAVNKCLTPDQIEYILKASADSTIYNVNQNYIGLLGSGKLNAYKAVEMAKKFNTFDAELKTNVNCIDSKRNANIVNLTGQTPLTYKWSNSLIDDTIEIDSTNLYTVEVTDNKGCKFYAESEIRIYDEITSQSEINHVKCYGLENGAVNVSAIGGDSLLTYIWSTGDTTNTITNLKPGYYQVSIKDVSGCVILEDFNINEPELLVTNLNYTQPTQNAFGSIDLDVTGGTKPYSYQWNHGEISEDLNSVLADFYEVLVTDNNGCMSSENVILQNSIEMTNTISETEINIVEVYPNPSNGLVNIKFNKNTNFEIFDMAGKLIKTFNNSLSEILIIETPGVYYLKYENYTKQIIIK